LGCSYCEGFIRARTGVCEADTQLGNDVPLKERRRNDPRREANLEIGSLIRRVIVLNSSV